MRHHRLLIDSRPASRGSRTKLLQEDSNAGRGTRDAGRWLLLILCCTLMLAGVASALSLQLDHVDTDLTHGCQYFNVLNNGTDKAAEVPGTRLVGYNIHLEDVKSISWEINRNGGWHPMKQSESYRNGRSQIRFCAGWVPRETENGWGVSMDVIPTFDGVEYPQYAWFNATWAYRVNCTINTTVSSSLINFPAHCIINTATLIAAGKMNTSCQDVRVLSSDGVTQLSYEIEACNATNTVLWVNIPATTANGNSTRKFVSCRD